MKINNNRVLWIIATGVWSNLAINCMLLLDNEISTNLRNFCVVFVLLALPVSLIAIFKDMDENKEVLKTSTNDAEQ